MSTTDLIPKKISRETFLTALSGVFDLLGLGPNEVYEMHFDARGLTVLAVAHERDGSEYPPGIRAVVSAGEDDAREFSELAYQFTVEVDG